MGHTNDECRLTHHTHQQQTWSMEFIDNGELAASVPPALATLGLGQAATYLETHPEYLVAALKHSDWTIRTAAVQVQGKRGDSIQPLLYALRDENAAVRAAAARALGTRGKEAPIEPLVEALKDREWRVRTAAALALGRLKNQTPVEPLLPVLHDENASVRAAAVWALGTLGKRAPMESLVIALQDKAWAVREAAVMALHEQGERAPVGHLLAARWDEDSSVREAVDNALGQRFEEQEGLKILPAETGWLSLPWLRLALSVFSVYILIPLTSIITNNTYIGRFALISEITATVVVCIAIALINILYQRKPDEKLSPQKYASRKKGIPSWHNVVLAGISVYTLVQIASSLLQMNFAYDPVMTADTIHFILISRLVALGLMAATVIVINMVFFTKR
jgi:hypothetical protein